MPSASPRWRQRGRGGPESSGPSRRSSRDDFDQGLNGWTELTGNYRQDTMAVIPGHEPFTDLRRPC